MNEQRGLARSVVGDGVPLLMATAGILALAGGFAMFLSLTGEFLPHDLAYLGMSADELCGIADCHVVHFMLHDRMAFGGSVFGIGVLYGYLALFPLRRRESWAWWLLALSGVLGFSSFLGYLSFGYLDTWHAAITLFLLPLFVIGLIMTWRTLEHPRSLAVVVVPVARPNFRTRAGIGRVCLLLGAAGTFAAGTEIFRIGLMETFVPADLTFLGVSADHLEHLNDRLVPLVAHDRAGFGAAVVIQGLLSFGCLWSNSTSVEVSKALWQTIFLAGVVSLSAAIGTHFIVGYIDLWHLAPPVAAAVALVVGLTLSYPVSTRPVVTREPV
ncbi:hypothetical protein GCM10007304_36840 [Rhodococcoides trifolii]|uniref:DUF998 domain-containing protein n=1 Tax=Rhodococcoides trifolii TaxID=908250 RepID=A0A917G2T2_9NOCA|nr:hypothetical protein [Rhodococcus trifolii]GGG19536.1 hypothetical protein GCM10007304_36840 [Rhodococcus trifolii]